MKKTYEIPEFEVSKFSFEEILKDAVRYSDPEETVGEAGGDAPDIGDDW